jgi:transcription elongation factor Elf1
MTLSEIFKTKYEAVFICSNCKKKTIVRIPMGIKIKDYIENEQAKCEFCGVVISEEEAK